MNIIEAQPRLFSGAPQSWLFNVLSDWMEWAPGDSGGSTKYANLEDLKVKLDLVLLQLDYRSNRKLVSQVPTRGIQ